MIYHLDVVDTAFIAVFLAWVVLALGILTTK